MKAMLTPHLQQMEDLIVKESVHYLERVREVASHLQELQKTGDDLSYFVLADLCDTVRTLSQAIHQVKFFYDWEVPPGPEWHDHFLDQHYILRKDRKSFWLERGVYSVLALKQGCTILELCCGDGYMSNHFYSPFASRIIAVDFDDSPLQHAARYNAAENIEFVKADIRTEMPDGTFDNIIWDAAIEHFTEEEIFSVMNNIKQRLGPTGILSGHTIVEKDDGTKHLHQHEREFQSKQDLANFLTPYFSNVRVFETIHPTRHNLYFYASDHTVPFDGAWPGGLHIATSGAHSL